MKILIVGEFSGFAKNLSVGFEKLGHEAVIVGYGDGWKKIDVGKNGYLLDYRRNYRVGKISIKRSWMVRSLIHFHRIVELKEKYKGYFDRILIINYEFLRLKHEKWYPYFSNEDLKQMLESKGKIFLSACGSDYVTCSYFSKLRYTFFPDFKKNRFFQKRYLKIFRLICRNVNGVIPVMYEYAAAYREVAQRYGLKIYDTIPLAMDIANIAVNNVLNDRIVIFHGINRPCKGTAIIEKALDQLKAKYPDRVEVVVKGGMPLEQYLHLMQKTNIIIDQCWSYSYGMNAIYGMAMGKVVLSGNEPECGEEFKQEDVPVVNILPEVKDIVAKLEFLVTHPDEIVKIGERSRRFVENFHKTEVVAKRYINLFNASDNNVLK